MFSNHPRLYRLLTVFDRDPLASAVIMVVLVIAMIVVSVVIPMPAP